MTLGVTLIRRLVLFGAFALGTFAVFTRPAAAQIPSPALLITIRGPGEHSLAIADPLTGKVVGSVPIGGGGYPHEVAVSDDGKLAFVTVTNYGEGQRGDPEQIPDDAISVIDLAARKQLHRVEIGPGSGPHGIVFAGGKVYFTAEGYQLVGRYDPASNQIDWMLGTGQGRTHMLAISKDMNKIFTANTESNSVTAIEPWKPPPNYQKVPNHLPPRWIATAIPVGKGPEGIAISPDGKEVWTTTFFDGGVSIIDVATKKVLQTLNLKPKVTFPLRLQFTPDGKRVLIADGYNGELLVLDAVTRKEIKMKRINLSDRIHGVLITPDGSRAYVTVLTGNNVAVIDLKTLELTGRISTGTQPEAMAWAEMR
jgi:YVTN family beta-propeller protein